MYDKELAIEILFQIYQATQKIQKRFEPVDSVDHFTDSEAGMEKLDAICMQLIAIGESLKNLDKVTEKGLLNKYPQIEWKKVMGLRDVITHHYFDLNADAIFDVCSNHIGTLSKVIESIQKDLTNSK